MANFIIDDKRIEVTEGKTILEAVLDTGIYIPHICAHPDLPTFDKAEPVEKIYRGKEELKSGIVKWNGCGLCVVEIDGILQTSCNTLTTDGVVVHTATSEVNKARREALAKILARHPHSCIICAQKEGCSITQCSTNVPENERCCPKFGNCGLQKVAEYIGVAAETPKYIYKELPVIKDEPLFIRNFNLCIGCLRCVRMCKDVRGVGALGFILDNVSPIVGSIAPTFKESGCKFCGSCAEVCPTGAIMDKNSKGEREALLLPCVHNCPIEIDVPRYIHYIAEHRFSDALSVVMEKTPFPGILGHICEHPCEANCRRKELNEPISICALKRFVVEDRGERTENRKQKTEKRIAIVGAGPAGLTAGYYLSRLGHSVTIFDAEAEPGGMMLTAIPRYRLPIEVLRKEINEVLKVGIEFKNNTTISNLDDLKGYDAIFLAIGAGLIKRIAIEGIDADGVLWGLEFLRDINLRGAKMAVPPRVVVVGGGNVAIDVALSSLRLGAKEVKLFSLENRHEMPAYEWEINQAIEEGVSINCGWGPKKILQDKHRVVGIEFMRCTSVFDTDGKFNPSYDESETTSLPTDLVIMAIGQVADLSILGGDRITETLATTKIGVFAGGDVVSGTASVVKAIAHGRKAAILIDKELGGNGDIQPTPENRQPTPEKDKWLGREEGFADKPRVKIPRLDINQRKGNFNTIELSLSKPQAIEEARRCLRCDLRFDIKPEVLPPEKWMEFNISNVNNVPESEGVFRLLNEAKVIIYIKGTQNLKQELETELSAKEDAKYFLYEEEPMYTKRESELIQHFLQAHGKMPKYNEELEDLF